MSYEGFKADFSYFKRKKVTRIQILGLQKTLTVNQITLFLIRDLNWANFSRKIIQVKIINPNVWI